MSFLKRAIVFSAFVLTAVLGEASVAAAQDRLALVIGQGAYQARALPTAVNDAGLIAQSLTSAGFEVVQGRDLSASDLRSLVRDFLDKVQDLEPGSTVAVYLAGHGVQLEGENYLLPVDARIERDVDVPIEGFRLSDLVRSLERSPAQARVIVADMARDYPLGSAGEPVAKGLALMEAPAGFLVAFSSAPNIVAADGQGPYGAYATALAEMIRQPGLPLDEVFARARLRTHEATNGQQIPWHTANLGNASFAFFEQAEGADRPLVREVRRIEDVPAEEAYAIAVERDTIQGYQDFLRRYPDHRLARRVTALLAARREAVVWRRTLARNTREAYWTYLRHYPNGPHAPDSRRRLARLSAPYAPPAVFDEVVYEDLPPPLPEVERVEVVEVVTIIRDVPPPPDAGLSSAAVGRGRGVRHHHPRTAAAAGHGGRASDPDADPGSGARPAAALLLSAHRAADPARAGGHSRRRAAGLRRAHGRRRPPPAPRPASGAAPRAAAAGPCGSDRADSDDGQSTGAAR